MIEAMLPVANKLGLEMVTGEDWIILTGARSRLGAFARPWVQPEAVRDLAHAIGMAMPADFPVIEFWKVVTGDEAGRTSPTAITIFDSVGFAIEDFTALRYVRDSVDATDFYTDIDLVANPDDPKDLFGFVGAFAPVGG